MKIVKIVLIVLASIIALFYAIAFFLPTHCHLERSIVIKGNQKDMFDELNSFKNFNNWSPWAKKDPNAKYWFAGPDVGVGNKLSWNGDPESVGSGSQTILSTKPNEFIDVELIFEPMVKAKASYKIEQIDAQNIKVFWNFDQDFESLSDRYWGLLMDKFLGPDYEEGVKNLKIYFESKYKNKI